jgi:CheY-like chemotaxis protein
MKKILIAEDDKILSMRLVRALEKHGDLLDVIDVGNGKDAMDVLAKHQIALLVTDIHMPEVDGFELLAHVSEHYPVIPCFVMTAIGAPEVKPRLPRDLIRFFPKPFEIDTFTAAVLKTVERDIPRGIIRGISVASFCTMIEMEKKRCLFEVEPEGEERGLLYFDSGTLYDASFAGLKGEAAAVKILGYENAAFKFRQFPEKKVARKINKSLAELIEEGFSGKAEFDEIDWSQIVDDDAE